MQGTIDSQPAPEILPPGQQAKPPDMGWPIYDLKLIGGLPFFLLARRYGELWRLDNEELETLAQAWKPVLDRYLPLENTMWGTAALITLAMVGPRAMQTDWSKGKKSNSTPPVNTKTAAGGESSATSESGSQERPPEWDVISEG